jgi:hypothetical protein
MASPCLERLEADDRSVGADESYPPAQGRKLQNELAQVHKNLVVEYSELAVLSALSSAKSGYMTRLPMGKTDT